ncbi:MAG TPA: hypothetical protein HA230_03775 [Candidatus Aenigmarchaeota archaeon]|nr:hypothetical protein [Candidatus Aenigmarchaeota archaeon]
MTLEQLSLDSVKSGRFEYVGSMYVGDSWIITSDYQWLVRVIEEEAPPTACGYFFG